MARPLRWPELGPHCDYFGKDVTLRQVPCCTQPARATFCISAGCAIDESRLLRELDLLGIRRERIIVDPRAVIVTDHDRAEERRELSDIGSTCSGTGSAQIRRMSRRSDVLLSCNSEAIKTRCRVETVAPLLHRVIEASGHVIVEGTQGFALSLLHGPVYPYVTSRDTTAAAFAMEVGLSPRLIDEIVMVVRTFPIRVGGKSGPFSDETTWEDVALLSGAPSVHREYTSVTNRLRRVAHFDLGAVKTACEYNRPTSLALMGLDRLDFNNHQARDWDSLTHGAKRFVRELEVSTGVNVSVVGTGFRTPDAIFLDRRDTTSEAAKAEPTYA